MSGALKLLLVDGNAARLAHLGAALRERGFDVALAAHPKAVLSPTGGEPYDMLLVAEANLRQGGPALEAFLRKEGTPYLVLVADPEAAWTTSEIHHADVDLIARRVTDVLRLSGRVHEGTGDPIDSIERRTGALSKGALVSLVRSGNERGVTGVLSITTAEGAGELRFARGELVDAVFSKIDGVKALYRLARETEGSWTFTEASPLVMRRITAPTAELLRAATMEVERVDALRQALGDAEGFAFLTDPDPGGVGVLASAVAARLASARTLEALLDESPETDAHVLAALVDLDRTGLLRRVRTDTHAAAFDSPAQWSRVGAQNARAQTAGFRGPARVVFAGTRTALSFLAYAAGRLDEATGPSAPLPAAPVPSTMVVLRVAEEAAVELVALPLDPASSPLWPLTLAGSVAVVLLEAEPGPVLRDLCAAHELPLYEASLLVPTLDPGAPEHVARLVRAALDVEP